MERPSNGMSTAAMMTPSRTQIIHFGQPLSLPNRPEPFLSEFGVGGGVSELMRDSVERIATNPRTGLKEANYVGPIGRAGGLRIAGWWDLLLKRFRTPDESLEGS